MVESQKTIVSADMYTDTPNETDTPNKEESLDKSLNKVDEEKFQEYVEMIDYIRENGWEYEEEYEGIVNNAIKPLEDQINKILNKNMANRNLETRNLVFMPNKEMEWVVAEILNGQPDGVNNFKDVIKAINENWSPDEILALNNIVNENMNDVQNFYTKIINKNSNYNGYEYDQAA